MHKQWINLDTTYGGSLVSRSGQKDRGHTREEPEQHHMLRLHKRATLTQRAASPEPCNSTTRNTTTGNATRARQHLATPAPHAPRQAAEKRASNKTGGLMPPFLCYNRKAEVDQEPQKTKQARNLKSSTFTRMAQHHYHESLS